MQPERPDYSGLTRLKERHSPRRRALWTTLVYLVAGLIWITFSDRIVELWFPDARMLSLVQTWKGFLFVVVTSLVLFTVILRQLHKDRLLLSLQADQRRALEQISEPNAAQDAAPPAVPAAPPAAHAPPRAGEILRSCADLQRTRAVLGYAPSVELDEGLAETLAWFRS